MQNSYAVSLRMKPLWPLVALLLLTNTAFGSIWITAVIPSTKDQTAQPAAPEPAKPSPSKKKQKPKTARPPGGTPPARPMIPAGENGIVELGFGSRFPVSDSSIPKDQIDRTLLRLGAGRPFPLTGARPDGSVTKLDATYLTPGTATLGLQLVAAYSERGGSDFEAYLEEIGATAAQEERKKKKDTKKPGREVLIASTKSFAGVYDPSGRNQPDSSAPSFSEPLGFPLEFIVKDDPLDLRSGRTLSVTLLQSGQPVANQVVTVTEEGSEPRKTRTGENGSVEVSFERQARVLFSSTVMRRLSKQEKKKNDIYKKADWESQSASLQLEILAPRPVTPTPTPAAAKKRKK